MYCRWGANMLHDFLRDNFLLQITLQILDNNSADNEDDNNDGKDYDNYVDLRQRWRWI